jgi:hypothetical protein
MVALDVSEAASVGVRGVAAVQEKSRSASARAVVAGLGAPFIGALYPIG